MKSVKRSNLTWLVVLLAAGVLALTACTSTPLPPLFVFYESGAARPAAPAVEPPAPEIAAAPAGQAPSIAASDVVTTSDAVAVVPPAGAAPAGAAVITPTIELAAAVPITGAVKVADAITSTAPITATAVITQDRAAAVVAPAAQPAPAVTSVAPTATRRAPAATRVVPAATRVAPTATRVAPTATRAAPAATRTPARPTATPTPEWPKTLVITAEDIEEGATSVPGLQIAGLDAQFGNNAMTMRFDSLRYSFVSLRNVTIEGRFVVDNCDVDFVADRITPRNLATGAIPGFINQSLDQELGAWCVESLAVQPGQLVATVRPR